MENASKALLIAGGMLLLIALLTFAIYTFNKMGKSTSEFYAEMSDTEINEYNQQFFQYDYDMFNKKITIQDVVSIINLVIDNNEKGIFPKITIEFNDQGLKSIVINNENELNKNFSMKNIMETRLDKKYICRVKYAEKSVYIGKITIE